MHCSVMLYKKKKVRKYRIWVKKFEIAIFECGSFASGNPRLALRSSGPVPSLSVANKGGNIENGGFHLYFLYIMFLCDV